MSEPLEFVFSLRSPYAWIAARHVLPQLGDAFEIRWHPFFPLPSFTNFPGLIPHKQRYLIKDVTRLTDLYGMKLRWPKPSDPSWAVPHAAFVQANLRGRGPRLALALFEERFGRGEDVASAKVIRRAAESVGLDAEEILAASHDAKLHEQLVKDIEYDYTERGIFGVPMLIKPDGDRFWGHDRIEWAVRGGRVG